MDTNDSNIELKSFKIDHNVNKSVDIETIHINNVDTRANEEKKIDDKKSDEYKHKKIKLFKLFDMIIINRNLLNNNRWFNMSIMFVLLIALSWLIVFILDANLALPGGNFYSIWILFTFGHLVGYACKKIKIPALLGLNFVLIRIFAFFWY